MLLGLLRTGPAAIPAGGGGRGREGGPSRLNVQTFQVSGLALQVGLCFLLSHVSFQITLRAGRGFSVPDCS